MMNFLRLRQKIFDFAKNISPLHSAKLTLETAKNKKVKTYIITMMKKSAKYLDGVQVITLKTHFDIRGSFTEIFRKEWFKSLTPIQWNIVFSKKNALRGMRVHIKHTDYVVVFKGEGLYVLRDLRRGSPTEGKNFYIKLSGQPIKSIIIPPGVAHGFYFFKDSGYAYGVDHYHNEQDELRFDYLDPDASFRWPAKKPIIAKRDAALPPLKKIIKKIPAWKPVSTKFLLASD